MIGNPPWINWESLPEEYRGTTSHLWDKYELRPEKGQLDRMRGGKKDLSMLFVYVAMDNYVLKDGILGFVITQTVFKTTGAGDGFRRFRYPATDGKTAYIAPLTIVDLTDLQPFEGATNRTAVFICQSSEKSFSYPVPYQVWSKKNKQLVSESDTLKTVLTKVQLMNWVASPVSPKSETAPWLTVPGAALQGVSKVLSSSTYAAHEGVNTGGLNGCYWLQILKKVSAAEFLIENLHDVGKIKLKRVQMAVEATHLYPLLRGRDVSKWHAVPSAYLLAPQDRKHQREGIPEAILKRDSPKTFSYLKKFEKELSARADRKYYPEGSPFYTMRNMASYSLSPWKVTWPEVGHTVTAGVCGPQEVDSEKPTLPDHTVVAVSCENKEEAYYIAALLNSSPAQLAIHGYVVLHPSPHVLQHVNVPRYNSKDKTHKNLASLSIDCHAATSKGNQSGVQSYERQIDKEASELWRITPKELEQIQKALAEE